VVDIEVKTQMHVCRFKRDTAHIRRKRQSFDQEGYDRMMKILNDYESVTEDNCKLKKVDIAFCCFLSLLNQLTFQISCKLAQSPKSGICGKGFVQARRQLC